MKSAVSSPTKPPPKVASKNKARLAGEQASPRDVLEWQSLVASCLSTTNRSSFAGVEQSVSDDVDEFEVQSAASSIFHLSDSSTHAGSNWVKFIVADQEFRWGFLKSLTNALRAPYGVLYRDAPLSTVIGVIRTLERYWGDLCDDIEIDMVHNVYETIRDCYKQRAAHVGAGHAYNQDDALALKCASLHSLTVMLVEVNLISRDQRLVKVHVDGLVRLLFTAVAEDDFTAKATNSWLVKATASTCLCMMEKDVPTLLARQGAMYAREAMATEGVTAVKGFPKTSLAVTVLAHACLRHEELCEGGADGTMKSQYVFSVVAEDDNLSASQRYHFPLHLEADVRGASVMSEYARATVGELFLFAADVMKRMNAETIKRLSEPMRVLAVHAALDQRTLWPVMYGLIDTGNVHIMEFILDTHDACPQLFEGRRPCLLEKIITRANDGAFSVEQRQLCLRWIARQHALARVKHEDELDAVGYKRPERMSSIGSGSTDLSGSGTPVLRASDTSRSTEEVRRSLERAFLLDDCWMQLLPLDHDELQIIHLRVKVLAGCIATRVGDAAMIATGLLLWPGFADPKNSDKFLYAMRQLYRTMDTAEYCDEDELRAEASFIRAVVHASVVFPHTLKSIMRFLDLCDDTMRVRILAGFSGLFSQLDEQFEVLRVESSAAPQPASVISNAAQRSASTLAGMMRGLSLRLSRRSMGAAVEESNAVAATSTLSSPRDTPSASRAGSFKLPNTSASRRRFLSVGSDSKRSIESVSPTRGERDERERITPTPSAHTPPGESEERRPFGGGMHRKAFSGMDLTLPDMQHVDELEDWILADRTWSFLKQAMLRTNDLMVYRSVILRIVRRQDIQPCSVLKTIANYVWQYQKALPHLELGSKETGAAIIAMCQTACLAHLPLTAEEAEPSHQQSSIVEAIHEVLDAIQDGFPCAVTLKQACRMSKLLDDDRAWRPSQSLSTMATMLGGYIEAAVDVPL